MSVADELKKLNDLKEQGILSQEEFDQQKANLLGGTGSDAPAAELDGDNIQDTLGLPLILVPVVACGMLVMAFGMNVFQARSFQNYSIFVALIGSAVLVGMDASKLGFGKNKEHPVNAMRTGPVGWAIGQILLWVIAYPWYMFARQHASPNMKKLGVAGLGLVVVFVGLYVLVSSAIEETLRGF